MPSQNVNLTKILDAANSGDETARKQLFQSVHEELHRLASAQMHGERPNHTLQPTALVHEAYLKLFGAGSSPFENRAHFFRAAAKAMRNILIDHARRYKSLKRGGDFERISIDQTEVPIDQRASNLLALDEALNKLATSDPRKSRIVELRFFGGLSIEDTARVLQISPRTVKREWTFAKACLMRDMNQG